jgi:hypothetical protein
VGYSASSQIRKSYYSSNATATFVATIDPTTATISLQLSARATANISPGRYVYDTTITDTNQNVIRILEGVVDVSPCVTR